MDGTISSHISEIQDILLNEKIPSQKLIIKKDQEWFHKPPFLALCVMERTEQSPSHHPEGNVWIHTMMVVDEAAKLRKYSNDPICLMWAAFLHDVGKPDATRVRKGRLTAYQHDQMAEPHIRELLQYSTLTKEQIQTIQNLVWYHMHMMFVLKKMPYADLPGLASKVDKREICLLSYSDRVGRKNSNRKEVMREVRQYYDILCRLHSDNTLFGK